MGSNQRAAATGLSAPLANALSAHVELAENGVIHCLPWGAPRSTVDTRNKKKNNRFVTMHTSADSGGAS